MIWLKNLRKVRYQTLQLWLDRVHRVLDPGAAADGLGAAEAPHEILVDFVVVVIADVADLKDTIETMK